MGVLAKTSLLPRFDEAPSRLIVVDAARVLAVLFMIQGHALDVLLAPVHRQGAIFESWLFLRGLTAPMFLTLSGISFTLSSLKYWDCYLKPSSRLFRRVRRFSFFVLLGYAMHLPVRSFHDLPYLDAAAWQGWLQVDVLQCIGCTLLALQLMLWIAGTPQRFAKLAAAVGAFVVLFAPISWGIGWAKFLPLSAASYVTSQTGSLFPLFPWSAYVFFGSALGYLIARVGSGTLPAKAFLAGGAAAVLAGIVVALVPFHPYGPINFWFVSPGIFLLKSGSVVMLLSLLCLVTRRIDIPKQAMRAIAEESLVIYFIHVCILYGCIWHDGLRQLIGATLDTAPTLGWIALLLTSLLLLARMWNRYKQTRPTMAWVVRSTAFALAIAYGLK